MQAPTARSRRRVAPRPPGRRTGPEPAPGRRPAGHRIDCSSQEAAAMPDTFGTLSTLRVGSREYRIHRLEALESRGLRVSRLPYSLKMLLENLLLQENHSVYSQDIEVLARWEPTGTRR